MFNKINLFLKKYNFEFFDNLKFEFCSYLYEYDLYYFTLQSNFDMKYVIGEYYYIFDSFRVNVIDGIMLCLKLDIDGVRRFIWGTCCVPFIFIYNTIYLINDLILVNFSRLVIRSIFRIFIRIPWTILIYIYIIYFLNIFIYKFIFFFFFFNFFFFIIHLIFVKYSFFIIWNIFSIFLFLFLFSEYCGIFGNLFFIYFNFSIFIVFLVNLYFYIISTADMIILSSIFYYFDFYYTYMCWVFGFDKIILIMFILVSVVSFGIYGYVIFYMRYDPYIYRFLYLLALFIFFMLFFVSSLNLIQLLMGWEGIGLCSYLLINFWYTRIEANQSAIKAIILNKIGDVSFLIFIIYYYYIYRSFDIIFMYIFIDVYKYVYIFFFGFFIHLYSFFVFFLLGAIIVKSAQLGLHMWLPDAMEGPTPVSALIHAATMVTAGIYLCIKFFLFFEYSLFLISIMYIGSLTALFGSIVAGNQYDIKKIIAFSTCSQLGYMLVACSSGFYNNALFHLFNHGFFKALLFLLSGIIIHELGNEQDIRRMGLLYYNFPLTLSCMLIGLYSLIGLPYFSGYFSKELIMNVCFSNYDKHIYINYNILLISLFFTVFYSFRLIYLVFFSSNRLLIFNLNKSEMIKFFYFIFYFIFFSIFGGFFFKELVIGFGVFEYNNFFVFRNFFFEYEFLFFLFKLIPFFMICIGFCIGYFFLVKKKYLIYYNKLNIFFNQKWYFDQLSYFFFNKYFIFFSYFIYKKIDRKLLVFFGVYGLYYFMNELSFFYKIIFLLYMYIYMYILFYFIGFGVVIFSFIFFNQWLLIIFFFILLFFFFFFV